MNIAVDRKAPKPLHRQIYNAYRTAIVDGKSAPRAANSVNPGACIRNWCFAVPCSECVCPTLGGRLLRESRRRGNDRFQFASGPVHGERTNRCATRGHPLRISAGRAPLLRFLFRPERILHGYCAGEHLAWDKWLLMNFHSTSGRIWSRAFPKYGCRVISLWQPDGLQDLSGKPSRAI